MFREEFYFHKNFADKEQLLKKMTQQLFQQGFVPEGFHDSIMKREAINQTNINEWLAIPHPMSLLAKRSAVAVAVLPEGVDWGRVIW